MCTVLHQLLLSDIHAGMDSEVSWIGLLLGLLMTFQNCSNRRELGVVLSWCHNTVD